MWELMHCGSRSDWPMIPPGGTVDNTLFKLSSFSTVADIKDTSKNAIAVTNNSGLTVGTDSHGSYINFNGGWLTASSTLMNNANVEINAIIGDMLPTLSGQYPNAFLDTRPAGTNGNYVLMCFTNQLSPPYKPVIAIPPANNDTTTVTVDAPINTYPVFFKLRITTTGVELYMNNKLIYTQAPTVVFNGTNFKLCRSAFSAAVANFRCKLYYFDIRSI
jgi:hypothetical protein